MSNIACKKTKKFSVIDKLHAIVVDFLASEVHHKQMCHLIPICSMPICWNTTHAEIEQSIKLKLAINLWVECLDDGLTGKKKDMAAQKKKKWCLSLLDWEFWGQ
ncbi:uncharacterized protein BJ212DRAFT_1476132 [Suillus subaureus]|uniref:Uncharacterized protein n=1 Tax=Suillus subaureus TaxID=48587 RepID=A0A9P7EKZ5_9AGAM|nr:uncharacterized protein BJ212DRAFT_1476132 [Suillus subaureus]KAG1824841.1 hypothetical protein BJ212DRAFT_1476132 [Suillus subaureus]